ncbi:MAG: hypothetical protein HOC70_06145 [Gammaproteobacteria bacterium]|jgi:hypothetical protein|nr:hypothetical protein [Gammaproteobacteria bacterium]MBT4492810.1 hypothetical protein [Gammaproteobacteria bacterium]
MKTVLLIVLSLIAAMSSAEPVPCSSEEHTQFDFWLGKWTAYTADGKTRQGTNHLHKIMGNCGMQENWESASGNFSGTSYNFYMASRGVWHQTWVDNSGGRLLLEGRKEEGEMVLQGNRTAADGVTVLDRITWTPLEDGRVRQHWQASKDDGVTWSEVFDGYYQREE